jgi:two-component system, OmpR family, alkaline phosphatase synthesis response regulator PhoP
MSKKILIVEDEPALVSALKDTFEREGFEVLTATDGKEGLESALKEHPDIIVLDLLMPVMDGMTMLDKLRTDSWGKTAKTIILTNLSDSAKETKSGTQGVHEYLIKSNVNLYDIVAKVKEKLA